MSNWMGQNVFDGFKWKTGRERQTTGINMWSEIFTHDYPNGRKVAIMLIDTQGIFDDLTSHQHSTVIFAMSTLISSVTIYNVVNNIQEDHLQHLQFFTEYSRLVSGQMNGKPFQDLVFVVRDWQYGDSEGFGLINGQRIINDTLIQDKNSRTSEMRQLRERILLSFQEIKASLLPHPGSIVRQNNFNGDLRQIDGEFLKYVDELAKELFAPENLLAKVNNGKTINAQNWIQYLDGYIEAFKNTNFKAEDIVTVS